MSNRPTDAGLIGNEKIEQAILDLQNNPTDEELAHTLTVIRRRMKEGGQFIIDVEPQSVGGMVSGGQLALKTVTTPDGAVWWSAFTSFDEELKGADSLKSTFLSDIDKLFETACSVPDIKGVIINPWNRTIMLDKTLIRIIKPVE